MAASGALLLAALAGAALAAPRWLAETLGEEVQTRAAARGLEVSWAELEVGYDLQARLRGLQVRRAGVTATVEEAEARWTLDALLGGRRLPEAVTLRGVEIEADVREARQASGAGEEEAPGAGQGVGRGEALPAVTVERGRVRLRGLPGEAPEVEVGDLSLQGSQLGVDGAWEGRWVGRCAAGCGRAQRLSGGVGRSAEEGLWARVRLEQPVSLPLEVIDGQVEVREVGASWRPGEGVARVAALGVEAPLARGAWSGRLRVERVEAEVQRGGERRVTLQRPRLELTRRAGEATGAAPEEDASGLRELPSAGEVQEVLASLERRLASVSVEGGEVRLGDQLHLREVSVSREPGGALRAAGVLWGGRVEARVEPGGARLHLSAEGVSGGALLERVRPAWAERAGGRLEGTATVELEPAAEGAPAGRYTLRAAGRLTEGRLAIGGLSEEPITEQTARISAEARYTPARLDLGEPDHLEVTRLEVALPARRGHEVTLQARGEAARLLGAGRPRFAVQVWSDEVACADALAAIPPAMLPRLHGALRASGRWAPSLRVSADLEDPHTLKLDIDGLPGTCALESLGELEPGFLNTSFRHEVKEGVSRDGIVVGPGTREYTRLEEIPAYVQAAMYLTEEISFYKNPGFGLGLMRRALILNLDKGRYVYGGSTVSQQLVKNLFLTRRKTLSRKLEEALIVWRMEEVVEKDRILELYLNCIEFGPDIYGIYAAAHFYFGKHPRELTPLEGAFLAGLKPAPLNGGGFREVGRTPDKGWWLKRHSRIMKRLYQFGHITEAQYRESFPFIVYFPNWTGGPVAVRDLDTLRRQEVEIPEEVIAKEGRLDWAPSPEQEQGLAPEAPTPALPAPAPLPTPEPDATPQPTQQIEPEPAPWRRLEELPRLR